MGTGSWKFSELKFPKPNLKVFQDLYADAIERVESATSGDDVMEIIFEVNELSRRTTDLLTVAFIHHTMDVTDEAYAENHRWVEENRQYFVKAAIDFREALYNSPYKEYIDSYVGFKAESLSAIEETFGLQEKEAEMLYYQLVLVALGLASTCTVGSSPLTIQQVSEILGKNVRAFLMVIHAGKDVREGFIPNAGGGPSGEVDSYVLMQALVGQNHLLQQLRAKPRYIQDEEWTELERMLRNSSDFRPESLREEHPGLTKGDIRAYILSHLQFSVSEQAILLGISPPSVTKARQRLKAKLLPTS